MCKKLSVFFLLTFLLSMPGQAVDNRYGPVKRSDTLWEIAVELRPSSKITVQQMMLALYRTNPQAFAANNINSLMENVYLQVPDAATINVYNRNKALEETRLQNQRWKRGIYKKNPVSTPPATTKQTNTSAATEPPQQTARDKPLFDQPPRPPQLAQVQPASPEQSETETRATTAISKPAVPAGSTSESLPNTVNRLRTEVATLKQQLANSQTENQLLLAELNTLRSVQNTARRQQAQPDPVIVEQVKLLESELNELKVLLTQKDNHIKTLQSNLKEASQAIKSQHADNMRLYDMLKSLSAQLDDREAQLAENQPEGAAKPTLQLAGIPDSLDLAGTANAAEASAPGSSSIWADEAAQAAQATATQNLTQNSAQSILPENTLAGILPSEQPAQALVDSRNQGSESGILARLYDLGISPISLIVAFLSLLFILFMVFQSIMYRRTLERIVDESMEFHRDKQFAAVNTQQPPPLPEKSAEPK